MGLFSKNYESSGSGISKDAARKKGFALFFELLGRKFWSLMWLNLHYFIFYIPLLLIFGIIQLTDNTTVLAIISVLLIGVFVITIGPATVGMMKVVRNFYLEKHSFITRDFFMSFKENFKPAAVMGVLDCFILLSAYASLTLYPALAATYTKLMYIPMVLALSVFLVVFIMNFYFFPMLAGTDLPMKALFKNSFSLAVSAPKQNLITVGVFILVFILMEILMFNVFPLFTLLLPIFPAAFLALVIFCTCYPMIQKYIIDPFYTEQGKVNPEYLTGGEDIDEETIFQDMGGKETPIENRKKSKAKIIK